MTEEELNNRLPIIPHRAVTDTDCPGCLVAGFGNSTWEVLCNECGSLIGSMSVTQVEAFFQNLYKSSR
jgi:ribosomal protein S27E